MKPQSPSAGPARSKTSEHFVDIAHETLKTFSLTHNYNRWIINLLAPYIGKRILEIGSGIGNLTFYLQHFGELSCLDVSDIYLAHMRIDFPNVTLHKCDIGGEEAGMLEAGGFDTVVCVNVLEHIEDDRKALDNVRRILKPGGRLLLYVPALQSLYSSLDRSVSHCRRYDRQPLERLLEDAGFELERLSWSNMVGVFGWFLNGKVQRKSKLSYWQTILFDKFVPLFEKLERRIEPPFGMSLFAVAHRPADPTTRADTRAGSDDA